MSVYAVIWDDRAIPRSTFPSREAAEAYAWRESRRNDTDYRTVRLETAELTPAERATLAAIQLGARVVPMTAAAALTQPRPVMQRPLWTPNGPRFQSTERGPDLAAEQPDDAFSLAAAIVDRATATVVTATSIAPEMAAINTLSSLQPVMVSSSDIDLVRSMTGATAEAAARVLEKSGGDIVDAISALGDGLA